MAASMIAGPAADAGVAAHEALGVVLQVRDRELRVLLWQRARSPDLGAWALPGGRLAGDETLGASLARHLAAKVDVTELAHLEQLETRSDPHRMRSGRVVATAYLGLIPSHVDPAIPPDTTWHPVASLPPMAFDHGSIVESGVARLRAKLSYTNIGFALAPPTFVISQLREIYQAALGHDVSATNLQRVLLRRDVLEPTGCTDVRHPAGGRPATVYRFRTARLEVTDQFAVLRPPGRRDR
ncbi:MAG TPA: NUDIX domain-containing protein [Mycobacteriales bacterium]|nr:NUDIX domain-containing protein [Mycobacteriales bacterium]